MVHRSQCGLLYGVLNGRWVPRLLPRLVIVSCSGSSMGTNRKWPMATWIVTVPPPLRPRPHEADHGDSRLGVIKRGVGRTGCLLLKSLMSRNYNVEACDKFPLPPCPDELDYPSVQELKVTKATYSVAHDHVAVERERWIEREQVKDKEREEEFRRVELERKQKEEEEQAEQLEAV